MPDETTTPAPEAAPAPEPDEKPRIPRRKRGKIGAAFDAVWHGMRPEDQKARKRAGTIAVLVGVIGSITGSVIASGNARDRAYEAAQIRADAAAAKREDRNVEAYRELATAINRLAADTSAGARAAEAERDACSALRDEILRAEGSKLGRLLGPRR